MKKLIRSLVCVLLCACLALGTAFAGSADFSKYSDAELMQLLSDVQQEIADRRIAVSASLRGGDYIAGADIPTGKYVFSCTYTGSLWANFAVHSAGENGRLKYYEVITGDEGTYELLITLEEGDRLSCDEPFGLTVYAGVMFR